MPQIVKKDADGESEPQAEVDIYQASLEAALDEMTDSEGSDTNGTSKENDRAANNSKQEVADVKAIEMVEVYSMMDLRMFCRVLRAGYFFLSFLSLHVLLPLMRSTPCPSQDKKPKYLQKR